MMSYAPPSKKKKKTYLNYFSLKTFKGELFFKDDAFIGRDLCHKTFYQGKYQYGNGKLLWHSVRWQKRSQGRSQAGET